MYLYISLCVSRIYLLIYFPICFPYLFAYLFPYLFPVINLFPYFIFLIISLFVSLFISRFIYLFVPTFSLVFLYSSFISMICPYWFSIFPYLFCIYLICTHRCCAKEIHSSRDIRGQPRTCDVWLSSWKQLVLRASLKYAAFTRNWFSWQASCASSHDNQACLKMTWAHDDPCIDIEGKGDPLSTKTTSDSKKCSGWSSLKP
jgi:hypothetical protein